MSFADAYLEQNYTGTVANDPTYDSFADAYLADSGNLARKIKEPQVDNTPDLGDAALDLLHMSGATGDAINDDGTPDTSGDFFGGSDVLERAGEGIGIASGWKENTEGTSQPGMATEIGKGLNDLLDSGLAGAHTTIAELINMVDTDNSVADHFRDLGVKGKSNLFNPDGVADAVGSELGSMAIEAPLGGKAIDMLMGGAKVAKQAYRGRVDRGATKVEGNIQDIQNRVMNRSLDTLDEQAKNQTKNYSTKPKSEMNADELRQQTFKEKFREKSADIAMEAESKTAAEAAKNIASPKTPQIGLISDVIGKLSPATKTLIDDNYDKIAAVISDNAAYVLKQNFLKTKKAEGFGDRDITKMWNEYAKQNKIDTMKEAMSKSPNKMGAAATLLGLNNEKEK